MIELHFFTGSDQEITVERQSSINNSGKNYCADFCTQGDACYDSFKCLRILQMTWAKYRYVCFVYQIWIVTHTDKNYVQESQHDIPFVALRLLSPPTIPPDLASPKAHLMDFLRWQCVVFPSEGIALPENFHLEPRMHCGESLFLWQSSHALELPHISILNCKLPEFHSIHLCKSIFCLGTIGRFCMCRKIKIQASHHEMEILA